MATARTPTKFWTARKGNVYLGRPAQVAFSSDTTISGAFNTSGIAITAAIKNISVSPPETGYDKSDFLGEDSDGFQNQMLEEKPVGLATITATATLSEDELFEDYVVSGVVSSPAGYSRYQVGKSNDTEVIAAVVLKTKDMADVISFGFDNARFIKWGDAKITGSDSSWEVDFTVICLAKDFYYEVKD